MKKAIFSIVLGIVFFVILTLSASAANVCTTEQVTRFAFHDGDGDSHTCWGTIGFYTTLSECKSAGGDYFLNSTEFQLGNKFACIKNEGTASHSACYNLLNNKYSETGSYEKYSTPSSSALYGIKTSTEKYTRIDAYIAKRLKVESVQTCQDITFTIINTNLNPTLPRTINTNNFQGTFDVTANLEIKEVVLNLSNSSMSKTISKLNSPEITQVSNPFDFTELGTGTYYLTAKIKSKYGEVINISLGTLTVQLSSQDTTPPAQVSNLQLTSSTNSSLSWSWTNPTDSDFSNVIITDWLGINWTTSSNTFTSSNLLSNTNYNITIYTQDNSGNINNNGVYISSKTLLNGNTNQSNQTDTTAPAQITGLKIENKGSNSVYIKWTNPTDSDFSNVLVYLNETNIANTSSNNYNFTGLLENTFYTFTFKTIDFSGNINNNEVSISTTTLTNHTANDNGSTTDDTNDNDSGSGSSSSSRISSNTIYLSEQPFVPLEENTDQISLENSDIYLSGQNSSSNIWIIFVLLIGSIILLLLVIFLVSRKN